jgi:hypothetical protein
LQLLALMKESMRPFTIVRPSGVTNPLLERTISDVQVSTDNSHGGAKDKYS